MASASCMHEAEDPKSVLWDNPDEQSGEGGGMGVQDGVDTCMPVATHADVWQEPSQKCKVIILQLK